jgi:hypothetical protein
MHTYRKTGYHLSFDELQNEAGYLYAAHSYLIIMCMFAYQNFKQINCLKKKYKLHQNSNLENGGVM